MWLAGVRDAAIVLLALESVVIGVLLAITLLQIRSLVRLLRDEIAPMLKSANETLRTVKGTSTFVSQNVVQPLVEVTSYSAGTLEALRNLFFIGRKAKKHPSSEASDKASGTQQPGQEF